MRQWCRCEDRRMLLSRLLRGGDPDLVDRRTDLAEGAMAVGEKPRDRMLATLRERAQMALK